LEKFHLFFQDEVKDQLLLEVFLLHTQIYVLLTQLATCSFNAFTLLDQKLREFYCTLQTLLVFLPFLYQLGKAHLWCFHFRRWELQMQISYPLQLQAIYDLSDKIYQEALFNGFDITFP
jgi:hypothetical protein